MTTRDAPLLERTNALTFEGWWEKHGQHYEAAVIEAGGTPWTTDIEERKALWHRRYQKPPPPPGLLSDLDLIRRKPVGPPPITYEQELAA
ncbi:hypothetical protein [Mycobacterium avium]|uniref:hypothetical protein n=1 Tax=Mycobacterium avium TaxID=1764 RepID=UPI00111C7C55|nr:hypothetical protein [Mycobacterium avium]